MSFYNRIDSVMLERLLPGETGREQAGIYAHAFRLLDAVSMFGVLFAGLLLPIFSKMIKQKEQLGQMIKLSYSLIIVPAIIIAVACLMYNNEILDVLYVSDTDKSSKILGLLMAAFTGIATTYIFGTLLTANGSLKHLNIMAFSGMVINVILNLILIPAFQAVGAAYASLVTQLFTGAVQVVLAIYLFRLKTDYIFLLRLISFAAVVVIMGFLSRFMGNWFYGFITLILVSVLFAFVSKLYNLKDLYNIIRYDSND